MDSQPLFGSDDETDGATHTHQEDFKRFVTHVMELSGESKGGSQAGPKMA